MVRRTNATSWTQSLHKSSINEAMSVFLMPFLKFLSVCADLSSQLILDHRSGPKCLRECLPVCCRSVETFLSEVCVSEVIVCVTSVKCCDVMPSMQFFYSSFGALAPIQLCNPPVENWFPCCLLLLISKNSITHQEES